MLPPAPGQEMHRAPIPVLAAGIPQYPHAPVSAARGLRRRCARHCGIVEIAPHCSPFLTGVNDERIRLAHAGKDNL